MTILILYATCEGQTHKIARFATDTLRAAGQEVALVDVTAKTAAVSLDGADAVILAAPVHERRHPEAFEVLLAARREELKEKRTLMLSVSLSAAFPEGLEEAQDYLTEMEMRTGFTPDAEALVAGAVKTGEYDYFASQLIRHVVLRGRPYDPARGAHEFTDWDALRETLASFLASAPAAPAS
ncbi:flavodoxin domain-containing protein [Oceaniglobus roseus]|uniref:flavodoxin domain-containing protein n=1 Tax=Oceaniglobus roseus TaxID=1737570 RepID=UPI000C7E8C49|nr:flavodoxin domain-containing protein [Kandeliimicrobium roseum]